MIQKEMNGDQCIAFSKKLAVLNKIYRMQSISEKEYILAKNRIFDEYHISKDYFMGNGKNSAA